MQYLGEDFEYFISERMQNNFKKLKNSTEYQETKKDYDTAYKKFINSLDNNAKNELEKIFDLRYYLFSMEISLAYKIGLLDGIKLDKSVK